MMDRIYKFIAVAFIAWFIVPVIMLGVYCIIGAIALLMPFIAFAYPNKIKILEDNYFLTITSNENKDTKN